MVKLSMRIILKFLPVLFLVSTFFLVSISSTEAATGINKQINFQGKVVNKVAGTNVANQAWDFTFKLYDASSAGTLLWTENWTAANQITTSAGLFRANLGSITALPGSVDFNTDNIYLEITFNGEVMGTRIQFAAVPYAFNARKVAGLTVTDTTGTLTVANGKTLTANNSISLSGTDGLGITVSGANITIGSTITPTAAGTLALQSNGANALTLDSGGAAAVSIGTNNANAITLGAITTLAANKALIITGGAGSPTATTGTVWYDTTANKFKIVENGTVKIVCNTTDTGCGSGSSGYATIQNAASNLTARTIVNFTGSGVTCVDNAGATRTDCTIPGGSGGVSLGPTVADALSSANNGIFINQSGSGGLLRLQTSGLDKFVVANNGGLTISAGTTDIVKTTTGSTNATDFSLSGSTLTNVTSQNDNITISDGSVPNSGQGTFTAPATVTTSAAVGAGSMTIIRDDGQYIVIHGGGLTSGSRWDGVTTGAMSASSTAPSTASVGAGAIALKRPDGRYLVINGGGSLGTTSLFDPFGVTATAAGPAVCGGGATTTGTNAGLRDDGKYVIICGGLTAWGIYDPTANTYTAGTAVGTSFGAGAHLLHRDDGTFLIFAGGNVTTHWLYNPYASATGTMTLNPIVTNAPTVTTGAFSIRRTDGKFLVMGGAINTSSVYDPTPSSSNSGAGSMTAQSGAGFGPTAALADGAQSAWREDGKYTLIIGSGSTVTNVIDPSKTDNTQFAAGATLAGTPGAGFHLIMRPDGTYQLIRGGASTATDLYDIGFVIGGQGSGVTLASYETECITSTALNINSTLNWNTNAEGKMTFQIKTGNGACSGTYKNILNSGDSVRPIAGDNRIQIKVFFQKQLPVFVDQEWGLRRGLGQTKYRRINQDPVMYDVSVDNGNLFRKTQFDFGIGGGAGATASDPSGPLVVNLTNNNDRNLSLMLPAGIGWGSTINATNASLYNGAWSTSPVALASAPVVAGSDLVMRRPDGKFMLVTSNAAANAQLYDPIAQTITAQSGVGNVPSAVIGTGSLVFKRPDSKFLIVNGNASTTTNIYDPNASTFTAGPGTTAAVGIGSQLIPLPTGRVLILHGNSTTTSSIYDPVQNVMYSGPLTTTAVTFGSIVIPRPDGKFVVALGQTGTAPATCPGTLLTVSNTFDPYWMTFTAVGSPAITGGPGAFTFQRADGLWVIVRGGATITTCAAVTTTDIYNPFTNKVAAGPALSAAAQMGAHAIPKPDGTWLIVHGSATSAATTSIYLEKAGAFTAEAGGTVGQFVAGPALVTAAGAGAVSFQRPDGKFVTLVGNATATLNIYDGGWVTTGNYKSEQVNIADLDSNSTLVWKSNSAPQGISVEVRTATSQMGLQTASWREIGSSGGLISPSASETWLQFNFNFKRSFSSYSGILADVWYTSGGSTSMYFPQRPVTMPTLNEYKVTKDVDLVNLKADGLSMFRVSSSGDIFTSSTGTVNTGGADLAERYTSQVPLAPGEVVAIDPLNNHGVKRTVYQSQPDILGVVSTAPGFVAGSYTKDSYPIALVGRVPVKVSTENGTIGIGDQLTSSSVAGYAMRATMAGRVLGTALEAIDPAKLADCPDSDIRIANRKCGTLMMFVNLTNYFGAPVEVAMTSQNTAGVSAGGAVVSTAGLANTDANLPKDEQILAFLKKLKDSRGETSHTPSEVFTDRVAATDSVITPKIITDLLIAKSIRADSISGLELFTNSISSISDKVANLESSLSATDSAKLAKDLPPILKVGQLTMDSGEVKLDFRIFGKLQTGGGLVVGGPAEFGGDSTFSALVMFLGNAIFKGDISFAGRPTFNRDTAGYAKIKKGADTVVITFEKEYKVQPVVGATLSLDEKLDASGQPQDQKALEKTILGRGYEYIISSKSKKGFVILLNKPAEEDLAFTWTALAVADGKTYESQDKVSASVSHLPQTPVATDSAKIN